MADRFDVLIIGMGPGGEVVSGKLIKAGKKVAVVEKELIGASAPTGLASPQRHSLGRPRPEARRRGHSGPARPPWSWSISSTTGTV